MPVIESTVHIFVRRRTSKVSWDEALSSSKKFERLQERRNCIRWFSYATCEDNFALVKFAKSLGVTNLDFVKHFIAGDQDDILIREDKTPNSLGAELVGVKPGSNGMNLEAMMKAMKEGKIKALYVMEDDVAAFSDEFEKFLPNLNCWWFMLRMKIKLQCWQILFFRLQHLPKRMGHS